MIWIGIRNDIEGEPSHPQPMLRRPVSVRQALSLMLGETMKNEDFMNKWQSNDRPAPTLTKSMPPVLLLNTAPKLAHNDWNTTARTLRAAVIPRISIAPNDTIQPSPTLIGQQPPVILIDTKVEGEVIRPITIEEAKILQSFPTWFRIPKYKYIGNSVPPLMAQAIGEHVAGMLDGANAD